MGEVLQVVNQKRAIQSAAAENTRGLPWIRNRSTGVVSELCARAGQGQLRTNLLTA